MNGDLINGVHETGNFVALVERKTRFSLVGCTDRKEAEAVTRAICALFLLLPQASRLGLTFDNGKEFARHEEMARTTGHGSVLCPALPLLGAWHE